MASYIRKHWRGELPLRVSFWGNLIAPHGVFWLLGGLEFERLTLTVRPDIGALLLLVFLALVGLLLIWQTVGVFRSARAHRNRTGHRLAATTCQFLAALILLIHVPIYAYVPYGYVFGMTLVAFGLSPDPLGQAEVFVADDNRAIMVNGPLGIGVSSRVKRLIRMYPEIGNIVLDGPGGSAYEARALHQIIQRNNMKTFSLESCSSACAIAFSGGSERFIAREARLGFHAIGPHHWDADALDLMPQQKVIKQLLLRQGISAAFVEQAFLTPHGEMWFPAHEALLDAGVIRGFVDPACSSGPSWPAAHCIETSRP